MDAKELTTATFAEILKEANEDLTIRELADLIGVGKNSIINWMHGHSSPSIMIAGVVLRRLGYSCKIEKREGNCT